MQRRADGTLSSEQRYKPWGEKRYPTGASTLPTTFRFTGQRQESSLGGAEGLYYYGARWYDPSLGRFAQADTIIPEATQGAQAWDRYAGMNNNPVRYIDPSGHRPCEEAVCPGEKADKSKPSKLEVLISYGVYVASKANDSGLDMAEGGNPTLAGVATPDGPPDFSKPDGNAPTSPPHVPGLPDDQWEWGNWPKAGPGWKNRADPDGIVWRPDEGYNNGREGEDPHWHGRRPGQPETYFPPADNYRWGRPGQRKSPGVWNPDKGLYESVLVIAATVGTGYLIWQIYPIFPRVQPGTPLVK